MLELLIPSRCLACRARADMPWCSRCAALVRRLDPGCPRCASTARDGHACWPRDAPVDTTVAAYDYRGPVAAAVVTAKVGGARRGWPPLAAALAARLVALDPVVDAVTWVTSVPARVRERGFDHAEVIAAVVAAALDVPLIRLLAVESGPPTGGGFRALMLVPGSDLVLVDDVVTTGTTAWSAAEALQDAGAGSVLLAVLARAGRHALGASRPTPRPA
jgi:predicted amidophosphoribosyltransferase